ncbi:MAG: hypothetical protein APF80_01060 [Alphaproteobacteria bacterium BRH_c36]|nr:MAG: hypothetical protein APF80_01060 [Alphaproteobacteria bacterium BRH_c36]
MTDDQIGPFKLISRRTVYKSPWLELREDGVIRPDGAPGTFGVITMKEGSSILPLDDDGQVYLVREFKYGIERDSIEVISGGLDDGETPLAAAQRELLEETGLIAREWLSLGCVNPFTTVVKSPNHVFLARNLEVGSRKLEAGEVLTIEKMKFSDALSLVYDGTISHAASCVAILRTALLLKGNGDGGY